MYSSRTLTRLNQSVAGTLLVGAIGHSLLDAHASGADLVLFHLPTLSNAIAAASLLVFMPESSSEPIDPLTHAIEGGCGVQDSLIFRGIVYLLCATVGVVSPLLLSISPSSPGPLSPPLGWAFWTGVVVCAASFICLAAGFYRLSTDYSRRTQGPYFVLSDSELDAQKYAYYSQDDYEVARFSDERCSAKFVPGVGLSIVRMPPVVIHVQVDQIVHTR